MLTIHPALHFMKFCCKPSFQLWLQEKCEKLLLIPNTSNGHFHCAEKASKEASLLLREYLFGALLAQENIATRKDLHQMPLQSWLKPVPLCSAAGLLVLWARNFQTFSFTLTACKSSSKSNDHLWAPKSSPDDYLVQVNILLIPTIVLARYSVCSLLGKKKYFLTNQPVSDEIKPSFTFTPTFWHSLHNCKKQDFSNSHISVQEKGYSNYRLNQNLL